MAMISTTDLCIQIRLSRGNIFELISLTVKMTSIQLNQTTSKPSFILIVKWWLGKQTRMLTHFPVCIPSIRCATINGGAVFTIWFSPHWKTNVAHSIFWTALISYQGEINYMEWRFIVQYYRFTQPFFTRYFGVTKPIFYLTVLSYRWTIVYIILNVNSI